MGCVRYPFIDITPTLARSGRTDRVNYFVFDRTVWKKNTQNLKIKTYNELDSSTSRYKTTHLGHLSFHHFKRLVDGPYWLSELVVDYVLQLLSFGCFESSFFLATSSFLIVNMKHLFISKCQLSLNLLKLATGATRVKCLPDWKLPCYCFHCVWKWNEDVKIWLSPRIISFSSLPFMTHKWVLSNRWSSQHYFHSMLAFIH